MIFQRQMDNFSWPARQRKAGQEETWGINHVMPWSFYRNTNAELSVVPCSVGKGLPE